MRFTFASIPASLQAATKLSAAAAMAAPLLMDVPAEPNCPFSPWPSHSPLPPLLLSSIAAILASSPCNGMSLALLARHNHQISGAPAAHDADQSPDVASLALSHFLLGYLQAPGPCCLPVCAAPVAPQHLLLKATANGKSGLPEGADLPGSVLSSCSPERGSWEVTNSLARLVTSCLMAAVDVWHIPSTGVMRCTCLHTECCSAQPLIGLALSAMSGNEMCQEQVSHPSMCTGCAWSYVYAALRKGSAGRTAYFRGGCFLLWTSWTSLASYCRRGRQAGVSLLGGPPGEQYHAADMAA